MRKCGLPLDTLGFVPIFAQTSFYNDLLAPVVRALVQIEPIELLLRIVSVLFSLMPDILSYELMVSQLILLFPLHNNTDHSLLDTR
jgi:hypothetical protein